MPILFVHMTEGRNEVKEKVAQNVTKAMCDTLGLGPEHITIVFQDIPHGDLAFAGKIVNKSEGGNK